MKNGDRCADKPSGEDLGFSIFNRIQNETSTECVTSAIEVLLDAAKEANAISEGTDVFDLLYWTGMCLSARSDLEEDTNYAGAIEAFTYAAQEESNKLRSIYARGKARLFEDDFQGAIEDFSEVEQLDGEAKDPNTYYYKAKAEAGAKQFINGLVDIDRCLELNEDDAEAHFLRGCILYKLDRKEDACYSWQLASDLGHELALQTFEELGCVRTLVTGRRS